MLRRLAGCAGMIGAGAACGGTEEEPCQSPECSTGSLDVALVDEAGASVKARAQLDTGDAPGALRFDCALDPSDPELGVRCEGGSLSARVQLYPTSVLELRFARADHSWTDRQTVPLAFTIQQAGEPGCSCPSVSAEASVVVPEGARLPEGGGS